MPIESVTLPIMTSTCLLGTFRTSSSKSTPNPEGDEFRMLLQAACFARIGNWLRDRTHDKPIVIMAIYISKDFMARQHVVYQPDVNSMAVVFHWVFTESLWLMQYFSF